MSLPEWDGDFSARWVEWDGVRLPVADWVAMSDGGRDCGWVALLPMENGCVMDLHLDKNLDGPPYCWVTLSYEATKYVPEDGAYGKEDIALWPDPAHNRVRAVVGLLGWTCDVESPEEVQQFLHLWGSLEVVPA